MSKPTGLYKTTITIWTDYAPDDVDLETLGREATSGNAYCSGQTTDYVTEPAEFPETDFFGSDNDDDEEHICPEYGGDTGHR